MDILQKCLLESHLVLTLNFKFDIYISNKLKTKLINLKKKSFFNEINAACAVVAALKGRCLVLIFQLGLGSEGPGGC